MSNETYFIGIINFLIFYILWFFLIKEYLVDSQRHKLFVLRDKLFYYAIEKNISFDNPAYTIRWEELNALIRLSHESHLIFFATLFLSERKYKNEIIEFVKAREKAYKGLSSNDKLFFVENQEEQESLFYSYLVKSSLGFMLIAFIVGVVSLFGYSLRWMYQKQIISIKWIYDKVEESFYIKDQTKKRSYENFQYIALITK